MKPFAGIHKGTNSGSIKSGVFAKSSKRKFKSSVRKSSTKRKPYRARKK